MRNILLVSATKLEHYDKEILGCPIHIIGIGKVEAAINTSNLISKINPDIIINFGSCGNLKDFKPGEVIEVGQVYNHFYADDIYSYPVLNIGSSGIKCFTTDTFYESNENYHHAYNDLIDKCDIVDMELYPIAYACKMSDTNIYSFKWVSDSGEISNWEENASLGYKNFKSFFSEWLEKNRY